MLVKAKQLYQEKSASALALFAQCRKHGGPLSPYNAALLDSLSNEQVLLEMKYLKATIAADLKLKNRITDPQTKKYKFIQLPVSELKTGIKSVLYPTNHQMDSVEVLLDKVFNVQSQSA